VHQQVLQKGAEFMHPRARAHVLSSLAVVLYVAAPITIMLTAVRPGGGWRSSSPVWSGGSGTRECAAAHDGSSRLSSPGAAAEGGRMGRGRRWSRRGQPGRADGLGRHCLVSGGSVASHSPRRRLGGYVPRMRLAQAGADLSAVPSTGRAGV